MPSVKNILQYLHNLFMTSKCLPSTLLKYKAALRWVINSSFHFVLDHVQVSRYITGLFNRHPVPLKAPRDIWDVNDVLTYFDSLPPSKDLPLMLLTIKTVLLVLISTMRRRCDIMQLCRHDIIYLSNRMIFPLSRYPKSYSLSNRVEDLRFVTLRTYPQNPNLCPVKTMQMYLRKTSILSTSRKVFVITQNPFSAASDMTVRRWVLTGLSNAGINIEKYAPSSTRHASSSKSYYAGVSMDALLKRAGWQSLSTFVCHYNLPIVQVNEEKLAKKVRSKGETFKKTFYFSPLARANAKNERARRLLQTAGRRVLISKARFEASAFTSPPPQINKQVLPHKVNVSVPFHSVRAGKRLEKQTKFVISTDVVPSTSRQ